MITRFVYNCRSCGVRFPGSYDMETPNARFRLHDAMTGGAFGAPPKYVLHECEEGRTGIADLAGCVTSEE